MFLMIFCMSHTVSLVGACAAVRVCVPTNGHEAFSLVQLTGRLVMQTLQSSKRFTDELW